MSPVKTGSMDVAGAEAAKSTPTDVRISGPVRYCIYTITGCLFFMVLYFARSLFLPIALALVLTLTLSPIVRAGRRKNVPTGLSAVVLTGSLVLVLVVGMNLLAQPVAQWVSEIPSIGNQVHSKLRSLRKPVEAVQKAEAEVDKLTEPDDPDIQKVSVEQPGLVSRSVDDLAAVVVTVIVTFGLTAFLLAYSDLFYEKLMRVIPKLSDKKRALRIIYEIEKVVSRYLLTITMINIGLGITIGVAMWAYGMPTPYLWGLIATLLNFLPLIGAAIGVGIIAVVALISLDQTGLIFAVPITYLALTALEGNVVTPMIVGRRLKLNPVVILLSIALWGFIWGLLGVLLAVPLLIIGKVFSDHIEAGSVVSEFLSGEAEQPGQDDEIEEAERKDGAKA